MCVYLIDASAPTTLSVYINVHRCVYIYTGCHVNALRILNVPPFRLPIAVVVVVVVVVVVALLYADMMICSRSRCSVIGTHKSGQRHSL